MSSKKKGLWQWVSWYSNWSKGCKHGCLYCYAMTQEVCRFKRMTYEGWKDFKLKDPVITFNNGQTIKKVEKIDGWGMLPGTHDIFPEILDESITYIREHLEIGNHLILVMKPHIECIKAIVEEFKEYRKQILFRFTITSNDDELLEFWEPDAPGYDERELCLSFAYHEGFQTSVSIEPFLDKNPIPLIEALGSHISEVLWIGAMNHLKRIGHIVSPKSSEFQHIQKITSTDNLIRIISQINNLHPLIKEKIQYKESFDHALELSKFSLKKWLEVKT